MATMNIILPIVLVKFMAYIIDDAWDTSDTRKGTCIKSAYFGSSNVSQANTCMYITAFDNCR
jgi:hypothetical protein